MTSTTTRTRFRDIAVLAARVRERLARRPQHLSTLRRARRALALVKREGIAGLVARILMPPRSLSDPPNYQQWIAAYDTIDDAGRKRLRALCDGLRSPPTISVLMPVYNTDERWLRRAIESVCQQIYPRWELCIADDCSSQPQVRRVLDEVAARDARIKVTYREQNGHIAAASNSALALARGDYVALLDHDDELPEHALVTVAAAIDAHPGAGIVYSDEDKIDESGRRFEPYFKPDWDPELILGQNYVSHLGVYRRDLVTKVGGFRVGYEGSQDYDLALRVASTLGAFAESRAGAEPSEDIVHIPHVLYHWRAIPGSTARGSEEKSYAFEAARRAVADCLQAAGIDADVKQAHPDVCYQHIRYVVSTPPPSVSVLVVPTASLQTGSKRRVARELARARRRLARATAYARCEYVLPTTHELQTAGSVSALRNLLASRASGEVLAFVDTDLIARGSPHWLEELAVHASRPGLGPVGSMIVGRSGFVAHAGFTLDPETIATPLHRGQPRGSPGYFGRLLLAHTTSAVSASALAIRRSLFMQLSGFDSTLGPLADVDLCLRAEAAGARTVWTPGAKLVRLGWQAELPPASDPQSARRARDRWGQRLEREPHHNANLSSTAPDFALAYPPRLGPPWYSAR